MSHNINGTTQQDMGNTLFPVFLKPELLNILIVGGGAVGLEKLKALLSSSPKARITLVAKEIKPEIVDLSLEYHSLTPVQKAFSAEDLNGKDIAIAATNDRTENMIIHREAKAKKVLVNVADTPDLCDFYLGSIVKKGNLKIGISTNGKSPTMAKRLREVFMEVLPDEMEDVLQNLRTIRKQIKGDFSEKVRKLNEITAVLAHSSEDPKNKEKVKKEQAYL